MLQSLIHRTSRAALAAMVLLAAPTMGCSVIAGDHDATTKFLVNPHADGTYKGWSEITISQDANSVKGATLKFARLELPDDSPVDDLTFIKDVYGELVTPTERVPVAQQDTMPEGEGTVVLDLLYNGDLRRFFPDGHTVRIEWQGTRNPAVEIPAEGLWVQVRVRVNVQ
jgi:hypothetical protein